MNPSNLKIGPRVGLGFGIVLLAILILIIAVELSLSQVKHNSIAVDQGMETQAQVSAMNDLAKENAIASLIMLVSSSSEQQKRLTQEIVERDRRIAAELQRLGAQVPASGKARELLLDLTKRHATYVAGVGRIAALIRDGKQSEAMFAADEEMLPMMTPFLKALEQLDTAEVQKVKATQSENGRLVSTTQRLTVIFGLVAAVLGSVTGVWLVRGITRPLDQAVVIANAVAKGDLTANIEFRGNDELTALMRSLAHMQTSLSTLVRSVRESAGNVATASAEIASGNSDMSSRTEAQASSLQQTSASMEQVGSVVRQNADNAQQANSMALKASEVAQRGGSVVEQVVSKMKGIDESSKQIADIVGVIDGIAFQTNILALNAAVEAARAGSEGRGFAVVAQEVRSLAKRSADAAKEIKSLIAASVERVEQGSTLVIQAGDTMKEVVSAIAGVSTIMGTISKSSNQQSTGVSKVSDSIASIDQSTQQNAAMVEQMAAAANTLKSQASALVQAVAVFEIPFSTESASA